MASAYIDIKIRTLKRRFVMTRKEQLQEIEERLKNGVEEYFTSEKYASLLRIMSKFYNYSFNNCIFIATQCPQACQNRKKSNKKKKDIIFLFSYREKRRRKYHNTSF